VTGRVYSAVRTDYLDTIQIKFRLYRIAAYVNCLLICGLVLCHSNITFIIIIIIYFYYYSTLLE